jgi:hypothetical protein
MTTNPAVCRWAGPLLALAAQEGIPASELDTFVSAALCQIHKESQGDPTATNPRSGAWGLTQQMPGWWKKRWAEQPGGKGNLAWHLTLYVRAMQSFLRQTGGYLPTAGLCWASGARAVQVWVQGAGHQDGTGVVDPVQKDKDGNPKRYDYLAKHLPYFHHVYGELYPAYSAWFAGWVGAGKPTAAASLVVAGHNNTSIPFARTDGISPASPLASPYDGRHRFKGTARLFEPAVAGVGGDVDAALLRASDFAPDLSTWGKTLRDGLLVVAFTLGGALLLHGAAPRLAQQLQRQQLQRQGAFQ